MTQTIKGKALLKGLTVNRSAAAAWLRANRSRGVYCYGNQALRYGGHWGMQTGLVVYRNCAC